MLEWRLCQDTFHIGQYMPTNWPTTLIITILSNPNNVAHFVHCHAWHTYTKTENSHHSLSLFHYANGIKETVIQINSKSISKIQKKKKSEIKSTERNIFFVVFKLMLCKCATEITRTIFFESESVKKIR